MENDLQKDCIAYLENIGIEYVHHGYRGKIRRGYSSKTKGYPDLLIHTPRIAFYVELKDKGKTLTDSQKKKIPELIQKGYIVEVIDDFEIFKKIVNNI